MLYYGHSRIYLLKSKICKLWDPVWVAYKLVREWENMSYLKQSIDQKESDVMFVHGTYVKQNHVQNIITVQIHDTNTKINTHNS